MFQMKVFMKYVFLMSLSNFEIMLEYHCNPNVRAFQRFDFRFTSKNKKTLAQFIKIAKDKIKYVAVKQIVKRRDFFIHRCRLE